MLDKENKVELPEKGVVKVHSGGKIYVQYTTSSFRNEHGKPTSRRIVIGKYDEETDMLIPNRNYYEYYKGEMLPEINLVKSCGVHYVVSEISKSYGITQHLENLFPDRWQKIMTVVEYMLSRDNVMYYLPDFCEEQKTFSDKIPSNEDISRLFASITEEERLMFFHWWIKKKKRDEYVAYDVTSFSSYSKEMKMLEWGYNRDKERLPQLNMGMYFGEESKLPLYYKVYPGSISDKAHLRYMVGDNDIISCKRVRYVMDRGFYSQDNLNLLASKGCRFIIALPGSLKYCNELIVKHRSEIVNKSECMLGVGLPFGKKVETDVLGFRMNVHIYYDPAKAAKEQNDLLELLNRQENDLEHMEEPPDRKLHYDRYFFINRSKDGKLGYTRNHKAISEELDRCGFFLIAETDFTKTTAEVLNTYRRRDVIEKSFDDLKNDIDMKRLHTQNDQTTEGKLFVAFIALIINADMRNKLKDYMISAGSTFKKILLELDKIKCISITQKHTLCRPLTKTQKDILSSLNLPILTDFV